MEKNMKETLKKIIPSFLIDWYHFSLSLMGAILYGFPSRSIKVIGVTGTNGKTTTVDLISRILEEAGYKVASLSSIKFKIKEKEWPNSSRMTMPGRFKIKKFLREAVDSGCQYAVIEVASEGVKQYRHKFIDFKVAVFTNLTPEHIEAHKGFDNYRAAKGKFFESVKGIHVINLDDEQAEYFLKFPSAEKYVYGTKKSSPNEKWKTVKAEEVNSSFKGMDFKVKGVSFHLNLPGEFNVYNSLAAICTGLSQGIDLETAKKALEKARGVPGRMEEVVSSPFRVFIDYAFTPNALKKVYQTIKKSFNPSRLICVLGSCGGGRDKWKRPVLGGIAGEFCDKIIVTNEDPFDEDPMEIIEQVAKGSASKAEKILDRREAISSALKAAKEKDVVVITGKGCESSICLAKGKKVDWNEKEVVRQELEKLKI